MAASRFIKEIVTEVFDNLFSDDQGICKYEDCRKKITESVSERLAAKYHVEDEKPTYSRIQGVDIQLKAEAAREIAYLLRDNNFHT